MSHLNRLILLGALFGGVLVAQVQTHGTRPVADPADARWARLQQYENVAPDVGRTGAPANVAPAGSADVRSLTAAAYLARARELRDFAASNPKHQKVGDARRLESLMLVYASYNGDMTESARRDELVQQVRRDDTLAAAARFSVASLADHREACLKNHSSEEARLAQFEQIERALIREFPTVPAAYEALLEVARDSSTERATRIATDLLKMDAPPATKDAARTLLERCALVGRPLNSLLATSLAPRDMPAFASQRIAILYTWATWNEGSISAAKWIAQEAPAGTTIIGVNLDRDPSAARQAARTAGLPGVQLYDAAAFTSKLARQLKLTTAPLVFVTDRQGIVRAVSGRVDLAIKAQIAGR